MRVLLLSIITIMIGCAGIPVNYHNDHPRLNGSKHTYIGQDIYFEEFIIGEGDYSGYIFGNSCRYELILMMVSKSKVVIEYNEYIKSSSYGEFRMDGPWLIRQGFTKQFEYELTDGKGEIAYKKLRFVIVGVENHGISTIRSN
jgi:hypothetical protein